MALIGQVHEFSSDEGWDQYVERLEHYFGANKVTDSGQKRDILLTVIGAKSYGLLRNLVAPDKPGQKTFEELSTLMRQHHNPVPSEIVQRCKFNSRFRAEGESVADFLAALRSLSEHCNYGSLLDIMLRDRLVCGIRDDAMQRRLLSEPNLDLKGAMGIAQGIEMAAANVRDLKQTQLGQAVGGQGDVHRFETSTKPATSKTRTYDRCFRCGKTTHSPDTCRFRTNSCFNCRKTGHIARMCRSKKRTGGGDINVVDDMDDDTFRTDAHRREEEFEQSSYRLYNVKAAGNPPMRVALKIDGVETDMEVDTGASLSIISSRQFDISWPGRHLDPSSTKLRTYTGELLDIRGEVDVDVGYQGMTYKLRLIVVNTDGPNLLGRDWLRTIKLNWTQIHSVRITDVNDLLRKHEPVFGEELGQLRGTTAKIHIEAEAQPRFCKARVVPYAMRTLVEDELDKLERDGVIEPIQFAEWAAPIVPVMKGDKKSVRICGDFKLTVNRAAKLDRYPIPKIEDLFASLTGGQKFSKLDLSQAYNQIVLDDDSKKYVVINTHKGLYRFNRLPFGVASAPGIFQRVMENLLRDIPHVTVYLDDVLVTGKDDDEHLATLDLVLQRFEQAGLRLKRSKCEFMQHSVEYLGHVIDEQGLHPTASRVRAIKEARAPENVTELRSYLGLLTYYGKFLPKLSTILAPLHALLRKGITWKWAVNEQNSFTRSKQLLISSQVLVHYDPKKEIIVSCDASPYGIGAVIAHRMEDGSERPIAFASRTLMPAEKKYAQIEKEGLSCVFGVSRFHSFLYGRRFTLVTDHKPLLGLFDEDRAVPAQASARIQRWALTLASYDYALRFKPTTAHANADALSRLPLPMAAMSVPMPAETVLLMETLEASPVTAADIRTWTRRDPLLSRVFRLVEHGWHDEKPDIDVDMKAFRQRRSELAIVDGCIMWGNRLIIPKQGQKRVLEALHEGHPGIARMKSFARAFAWWPKMDADIEQKAKSCNSCQENQARPPKEPLHPWSWPSRPWSRIHIDHAGPFMGKLFLLVIDAHSKWLEVIPVTSTDAATTSEKLRGVFATHGLPDKLVSDNGPSFTSASFGEFLKRNGIAHSTSSPYHPSSNGLAERAVRTFKEAMKKMTEGSLNTRIARFLLKYRTTPHSTTGISPSEMLMGRRVTTILDRMRPDVESRVRQHQENQKSAHDKHAKERSFEVSEEVYAENFSSTTPKWLSGKITHQRGPVSYEVELDDGRIVRRHADSIRRRAKQTPIDHPDDVEFERARANPPVPIPPATLPELPDVVTAPLGEAPRQYPARDRRPPNRYGVPVYH